MQQPVARVRLSPPSSSSSSSPLEAAVSFITVFKTAEPAPTAVAVATDAAAGESRVALESLPGSWKM